MGNELTARVEGLEGSFKAAEEENLGLIVFQISLCPSAAFLVYQLWGLRRRSTPILLNQLETRRGHQIEIAEEKKKSSFFLFFTWRVKFKSLNVSELQSFQGKEVGGRGCAPSL